ncbi:MAG: ATP-binding protein [Vicinamibacteria bacterium]
MQTAHVVALLDRIHTAVMSADADRRVTFANRAALEIVGAAAGQAVGRDLVQLFGGSTALAEALTPGQSGEQRISFTLRRPDDTTVDLGMAVVSGAAPAGDDAPRHVLVFKNVGEQLQVERQLRRTERLASVGRLAAGFAHEIRNPLAALLGLAELTLSETSADDPRFDYATRMRALVKRMERLVRGALDFAEPAPTSPRPCDPAVLARRVIDELAARQGPGGPRTALVVETTSLAVADPAQVHECIAALVENAVEATSDDGEVRIHIGSAGPDGVELSVVDSGCGIAEGDLERIFDPFFTTKARGTGLGLAVAQAIAARNAGSLSVRSRPGRTVFSLRLPATARRVGVR